MIEVTDTAAAIARVRAAESDLPHAERLFEDPIAKLFAGSEEVGELLERLLPVPFFREGIRVRTRFIDDCLRAGLREGARQVVLLGAGFDGRAWRLPELERSGAVVYEVDFADQLAVKQSILERAGVSAPALLRFVPADLSRPAIGEELTEALAGAGFDRSKKALFVWEGVVNYLDDASTERTLRWLATAAPGSSVVFNYSIARFDPESVPLRIAAFGFARFEQRPFGSLHAEYLRRETPPGGDLHWIAVATV